MGLFLLPGGLPRPFFIGGCSSAVTGIGSPAGNSAIVILLLICIPFAFALERLVCGFTTIHKQILGFIGFFLVSFLILYAVHPAFSISTTPSVIFLAFVIVIMSGMVIKIIMSKFKYELMAMQGLTSKSHSQSKSANVGMASVLIGISSMRNRPLKTTLTAFTVVLLTFTVLVFGSFSSQNEVVTTFMGRTPGTKQIQIFRNSLLQIPERWRIALKHHYRDKLEVTERAALFHDVTKQNGPYDVYIPAVNPQNGKILQATAMLGFQEQEWSQDNGLNQLLAEPCKPGVVHLSESTVASLGLSIGDQVNIYGKTFTLGACFNLSAIRSMRYIDNKKIVPPDYLATINDMVGSTRSTTLLNDQMNNIDTSSFRWATNDAVIIGHRDDLLSLGGMVNVVMAYPKNDENIDLDAISREIAQIFNDPIYLKTPSGDQQYFYTSAYSGSGFGDIWVPLLLGGLIIFSSLLGSIVDREREIYTFSALGLAPPNVAALFFAESSVYAVIGGMGGYLLSQAVASLLNYLSALGIYEAPEMNFSSLNSIYTIVLVMGIVLLSTIYPAIKAGSSANPGISRKWRMPDPENGKLKFLFPFTISDHNLLGIVSFIAEHFENHSDASLGMFAASHVQVLHTKGNDYGLAAHIALSPFDLGISQEFLLESSDSDISGIKEIHITLTHAGGSPAAWVRNNRRFLDDLRHQFLLWRSLPVESIAYYCDQTAQRQIQKNEGHGGQQLSIDSAT